MNGVSLNEQYAVKESILDLKKRDEAGNQQCKHRISENDRIYCCCMQENGYLLCRDFSLPNKSHYLTKKRDKTRVGVAVAQEEDQRLVNRKVGGLTPDFSGPHVEVCKTLKHMLPTNMSIGV